MSSAVVGPKRQTRHTPFIYMRPDPTIQEIFADEFTDVQFDIFEIRRALYPRLPYSRRLYKWRSSQNLQLRELNRLKRLLQGGQLCEAEELALRWYYHWRLNKSSVLATYSEKHVRSLLVKGYLAATEHGSEVLLPDCPVGRLLELVQNDIDHITSWRWFQSVTDFCSRAGLVA